MAVSSSDGADVSERWSTRNATRSRRAAVSASARAQYARISRAAAGPSSAHTCRMRASGMPSRRSHATSRARSSCPAA